MIKHIFVDNKFLSYEAIIEYRFKKIRTLVNKKQGILIEKTI
jgi:hypothetical protein